MGPNLWLCLQAQCLFVGCGETGKDHSSTHTDVSANRTGIAGLNAPPPPQISRKKGVAEA